MSAQELNPLTGASDAESDALATSKPQVKRSRFNRIIAGIGLIGSLLLLIAIAAVTGARNVWYVIFVAGLIAGFALGAVYGISIGRRLGEAPNYLRFTFATGIVVLNACVGFFAIPYLSTNSVWPADAQ